MKCYLLLILNIISIFQKRICIMVYKNLIIQLFTYQSKISINLCIIKSMEKQSTISFHGIKIVLNSIELIQKLSIFKIQNKWFSIRYDCWILKWSLSLKHTHDIYIHYFYVKTFCEQYILGLLYYKHIFLIKTTKIMTMLP